MTAVAIAIVVGWGVVTLATLALIRVVKQSNARLDAVQDTPDDTPHQAETREYLRRGGHAVEFGTRAALCMQLDEIISLPEVEPERVLP
jgi:hypothetical protein